MLFEKDKIKITIVGLGYVGLPLAIEFSKHFKTVGFDKNENRIRELKENYDRTLEIEKKILKESTIELTEKIDDIKDSNIYIVTVPTPIDENKNPDLSPLENSSQMIGKVLKKEDIVIFESTVYPGATEEYCVPIIEKASKLKFNKDFFCGYSPERINPGDKEHTLTKITKIVSGSNPEISDFINQLYETIINAGTFQASSIKVAEAAKVIENIQRDVNIALVNELSMIFEKLNINTNEVLNASGTKWNFLPFRPGMVGGHCIGVDPYYLTHKSLEHGYKPEMILAGRKINEKMSNFIAKKTASEMVKKDIKINNSKIAIFGLSFKENCPDIRNSKTFDLISCLKNLGANVFVVDPLVDAKEVKDLHNIDIVDPSEVSNFDAIILAVAHQAYTKFSIEKWIKYMKKNSVFIDVKSVFNKKFFSNTQVSYWSI